MSMAKKAPRNTSSSPSTSTLRTQSTALRMKQVAVTTANLHTLSARPPSAEPFLPQQQREKMEEEEEDEVASVEDFAECAEPLELVSRMKRDTFRPYHRKARPVVRVRRAMTRLPYKA